MIKTLSPDNKYYPRRVYCRICGRCVTTAETPKSDSEWGWICDECDRHVLPAIMDVIENIKLNRMVELELRGDDYDDDEEFQEPIESEAAKRLRAEIGIPTE